MSDPVCPKCSAPMLRARGGVAGTPTQGFAPTQAFWLCTRAPVCAGMLGRREESAPVLSPVQAIAQRGAEMVEIATRLLTSNESLARRNLDLELRLNDALEEVQTLRRQLETMTAEHQAIRGTSAAQDAKKGPK